MKVEVCEEKKSEVLLQLSEQLESNVAGVERVLKNIKFLLNEIEMEFADMKVPNDRYKKLIMDLVRNEIINLEVRTTSLLRSIEEIFELIMGINWLISKLEKLKVELQ